MRCLHCFSYLPFSCHIYLHYNYYFTHLGIVCASSCVHTAAHLFAVYLQRVCICSMKSQYHLLSRSFALLWCCGKCGAYINIELIYGQRSKVRVRWRLAMSTTVLLCAVKCEFFAGNKTHTQCHTLTPTHTQPIHLRRAFTRSHEEQKKIQQNIRIHLGRCASDSSPFSFPRSCHTMICNNYTLVLHTKHHCYRHCHRK